MKSAISELKLELDESEKRNGQIRASLTERWEHCQKEMEMENNRRKTAEAEARGLRSELRLEKDVIRGLRNEIEDLKSELDHLKDTSSRRKSDFRFDVNETENRLKKLTEALLVKQNMIDHLNSEKSALLLSLNSSRKLEQEVVEGDFLENVKEETKENFVVPSAPLFPRKLFQIATKVDNLYSQSVKFLSNRPKVRILFIIYLIMIHIFWLKG